MGHHAGEELENSGINTIVIYPILLHPLPLLEPLIESPRQVAVNLASSTQALDDKERDLVDAFINKGCGCKLG